MSNLKDALNEAKKKKKEKSKMLPELHALDDKIEAFIQKLETKINGVKDNPIFVQKAHQLLGDMSKEYSEFIFALRAIVNAVDRKGLVLPKEKPVGKVRDINSRHRSPDENQPDEPGAEEPPPAEEKSKSPLKEALLGEWNYHPDQAISAPPRKQQKAIQQMKSKGFSIVIWEKEYVAMMDKKGNPAEVYPDGTVKYPKKR